MPFADLAQVRLFYTDDGPADGAPIRATLLLVHGFAADSNDWVWHIPTLAEHYRVLAVDLRGHGHSTAPESGYRPAELAQDLADLLDHLGVDRVVAVGHSLGGLVVSALAVEHPAKVGALVCVDAAYGKPDELGPFLAAQVRTAQQDPYGLALQNEQWCYTPVSPAVLKQWHARKVLATAPHALSAAFAGLFGPGTLCLRGSGRDYLKRRACPILSFSFDPAQSAWEAELLQDSRSSTVTWQGSGHRLHEERPAEFLLVVRNWLKTLGPDSGAPTSSAPAFAPTPDAQDS